MLYVEPVYIESSNETSLPEVKQVIMAYDDYIVMEETFDKALDKILDFVESGVKPPTLTDDEAEDGPAGEEQPPILDAEATLREISELFDQYQKAVSEGNWIEAGEIMDEIQKRLP